MGITISNCSSSDNSNQSNIVLLKDYDMRIFKAQGNRDRSSAQMGDDLLEGVIQTVSGNTITAKLYRQGKCRGRKDVADNNSENWFGLSTESNGGGSSIPEGYGVQDGVYFLMDTPRPVQDTIAAGDRAVTGFVFDGDGNKFLIQDGVYASGPANQISSWNNIKYSI